MPDGTLADIFDGPILTSFKDLTDRFTTQGVTSTPFAGGTQHSGTLKSVRLDPIELGFGELELPGVTAGIPFRLALFDTPEGRWHLDIVANGLSLKLRDLHGADFVREAGTTPRRLIRRARDSAVVISGEATIRFAKASGDAPVTLLFVENRSAADPVANTGGVVSLRCTPPHFFFGSSQFGMTLTELLFDFSDTFSPEFITKLGQGPEWMGFAIAEATFYAPPNAIGRGGFSGGVRNLLIGSPRGLQGEFEVQWGRAPLDPSTFVFTQAGEPATGATGTGNARLVALTAGQDDPVAMQASFAASQPPEGGTIADWSATWRWPDGTETDGDVSIGQVAHGEILRVVPEEKTGGRSIRHPEISFRFVASGEVPQIDVITAGTSVVNAVHVSGPKGGIEGLHFRARSTAPVDGIFTWKMGANGAEQTGVSITLPAAEIAGDDFLVLKEADADGRKRVTRLRVQVLENETLLVGGEDGVVTAAAPTAPITPAAVENTFDLPDFHAQARYRPIMDDAEIDPSRPDRVHVPPGGLALVTIPATVTPSPTPTPTPPVEHDRHVRFIFKFAKDVPERWSELKKPVGITQGGSAAGIHRQLLEWAAKYPGATFLVVGRCDDLGKDPLNAGLAQDRRKKAEEFFTTVPAGSDLSAIDIGRITSWGEQDGQPGGGAGGPLNEEEADNQRLILAKDDDDNPLIDRTGWSDEYDPANIGEPARQEYRCVDIYAVGGTPATTAEVKETADERVPALRRMLMPGETADPVPAILSTPESDYRVRLLVGWDKPTGEGWRDLIPSKAEFEYAWSPQDNPLPDLGGQPVTMEVLTIYGSWRHDDTTGFTRALLGIRSDGDPDGLVKFTQPNLVAALALGPVLLSGVNSETDTIETGARIAALALGTSFAGVTLPGADGPLVGDGSKAVIKSIEASTEIKDVDDVGDDYKISLTSDYSTTLHVNTGTLGLKTDDDHPVKFRYKAVSIVFDQSKDNFWDKVGISYPTDSMEIEDPGKWKIDGKLGELLRAVETALGKGSLWVETRFAFALTIGVVEISEAVIRVTFSGGGTPPDVSFSLRGLVARIDIPATVKGEGRLRIEDPGGVIKAGIDIEIVPLQLKASAAFAMANETSPVPFTFVSLFLKVQFPVGIPLGPSGAALHGFIGQTAINGERNVTPGNDVVKRELDWWAALPENKYRSKKDQHALGIGAVVGTLPDASFSFSATGMIVVAFPDPEVIFAVEIKFLSLPDRTAKESSSSGQSAGITGLIVIDDSAVTVAAQARYEIPKILKVVAPFAAYFPYSGDGIYVRIGSDGQEGRSGEPVTLTLLPSTLNLKAFSYLMIEQNGLPKLGGRSDFSFQGFSVGFGAGAGLEWKAGPIRLSASILLLAGLGTDPLLIKAGIFVKGELDLVVVSVSARGEIILTYQDETIWMDGEFCGEVDLFFFSLKGCVRFRIGHEPQEELPKPPSPVASVMLTDRGGRVMGEARRNGAGALLAQPIFRLTETNGKAKNEGADPKENQTVWADTAPVINFSHFIEDAVAVGQFQKPTPPSGEPWFGSNRLKYAYQLNDVRLIRESDGTPVAGPNPLRRVWGLTPARQPGSGGPILPSGAETTSLTLLHWNPWGWALPMADGGASAPGNPADTIGNLCEPVPQPARACLFGKDARAAGPNRIRLLHEVPPPGPYPSWFTLVGRPGLRTAAGTTEGAALYQTIAAAGGLPIAGAVVALSQPVAGPTGPLDKGYRLPAAQFASAGSVRVTSLPWVADFDRTIRRGRLLLLVCDGKRRGPADEPRACYRFEGLSIGKRFTAIDVPGYRLEALDPGSPFLVTDEVALSQGGLGLGADTQPDIRILSPGMIIRPQGSARSYDLHFYRRQALATEIRWKDRDGNGGTVTEPGDAVGAVVVRVTAPAPIVEMVIAMRGRLLHLAEICAVGAADTRNCFDFSGVKESTVKPGRFVYNDVGFSALDPSIGFRLADWVNAAATPAQRGTDGIPELGFPEKGVEIRPARPWTDVTLGVFSGGAPLTAIAFDGQGNAVAQARADAREPAELHLAAAEVARVILSGGSNEGVLFRVCHGEGKDGDGGETCIGFGKQPQRGLEKVDLDGITITPVRAGELLTLGDAITDSDPVEPQPDGQVELRLSGGGVILTPDVPLTAATLFIATAGDGKAEAVAYDAAGNKLAVEGASGAANALLRLRLEGDGIARIELHSSGKTFLTRICIAPKDGRGGTAAGGLPIVVTRLGKEVHRWTPQLVGSVPDAAGGQCRLVAYDQPAKLVDAAGLDIVSTSGLRVTLLSLCGVDSRAAEAQAQDQAAQDALSDTITGVVSGGLATIAREVLLDPGQTYRVEVKWSWQGWLSNEDGTDSPDVPLDPDAWTAGDTDIYRFRVASEVLSGEETQDGLNEYVFDPRDLSRYLNRTEPADGRDVVFTDDPLWVHFSAGHVEALADRHGRELVLSVRRTDPPPQPDEATLELVMVAELIELQWRIAPSSVLLPAEQLINAAVAAAPCLPDGPVTGGASMGARFKLEKNAMYDFNLLAQRKGVPPANADPVVVNATRFKTSRYATPAEMLAGLGFGTADLHPFAPQEIVLDDAAPLPAGPLSVSDLDFGAALAAIGADTLPLPGDQARTVALWRRDAGGQYGIVGFLLDAPEPMRRVAAVVQGQQAVDSVRCEPDRLVLGGVTFTPVRATLNWTRVLFVASQPVVPADAEAEVELRLKVAPGGTLSGRRIVNARPLMLDTEGF